MADFDLALQSLLSSEGGYSPKDNRNGAVNMGITGAFLKLIGRPSSAADVAKLSMDEAKAIYQKYFWDAFRIGQVQDQRLATLYFHMVVNNPSKIAVMSFQLALQDVGSPIQATGFSGPRTILAANTLTPEKRALFMDRYKGRMLDRYRRLAASDQKTYADDLKGWEARLASL